MTKHISTEKILFLLYPGVFGIGASVKALMVACHKPQEICSVTRCRNRGMIALGELYQLIVFDAISFIYLAVRSVKTLYRNALLRVK